MNVRATPTESPARRRRIERTVETLIAMLDDGEPDLEATGDEEPYLAGWSGDNDDREDDDEREPQPDCETVCWSLDTDIPQEGPNWHRNGW
ncbi:hypothetical protein EN780_26850 [Mesorhizobium sp. M4B.F.Ca.ET.089.01.1.1]|uniref:hypothetical protein n=1 Tax=Mesorhizobium sp. M4B.F.Ca.ET.089.01.1.1 TaxID=2496662 RepID=UPI000FE34DAB|nr:hypothetical protein [Mesorhizobium sp. M4B.F.Ca.ET.089.01.1.1]RWX62355.1 hypothetical protein EN780_26850 [Mesorhizobium sp. M4B.F.Ca.ET.089.01.1.1]